MIWSDFVQQQHSVCGFSTSDSWVVLSPIEQSIKQKIESVGTPLKDWDINIYRGVLTGYNEAFIISTEKRDEILANCATEEERTRTAELIRPILRGRDIKRYGYEWAGLYLIATFPSRHYDIELYPAVKKFLLSFAKESLIESGYQWVADSYLEEFCKQKLEQSGRFIEIQGKRIRIGKDDEKSRKKTSNKWFETQDSISYWDVFPHSLVTGYTRNFLSPVIEHMKEKGEEFKIYILMPTTQEDIESHKKRMLYLSCEMSEKLGVDSLTNEKLPTRMKRGTIVSRICCPSNRFDDVIIDFATTTSAFLDVARYKKQNISYKDESLDDIISGYAETFISQTKEELGSDSVYVEMFTHVSDMVERLDKEH